MSGYHRGVPTVGYGGHMPGMVNTCGIGYEESIGKSNHNCSENRFIHNARTPHEEDVYKSTLHIIRERKLAEETEMRKVPCRTWAHSREDLTKLHNPWRTGIVGYGGHTPLWAKDQMTYELKREVGKVHPPYIPKLDRTWVTAQKEPAGWVMGAGQTGTPRKYCYKCGYDQHHGWMCWGMHNLAEFTIEMKKATSDSTTLLGSNKKPISPSIFKK